MPVAQAPNAIDQHQYIRDLQRHICDLWKAVENLNSERLGLAGRVDGLEHLTYRQQSDWSRSTSPNAVDDLRSRFFAFQESLTAQVRHLQEQLDRHDFQPRLPPAVELEMPMSSHHGPPPPMVDNEMLKTLQTQVSELKEWQQRDLLAAGDSPDPSMELPGPAHDAELGMKASNGEEAKPPRVSEAVQPVHEENFTITSSTWDLLFIAGVGHARPQDTILTMLAALVAGGMQVVFCIIVASMTSESFQKEAPEELLAWRIFSGHNVNNFDHFTQSSLVARVCKMKPFMLTSSTTQVQLKDSFQSALGKAHESPLYAILGEASKVSGTTLCLFCLCMWCVHLLKEVYLIFKTTRALKAIVGPDTILIRHHHTFSIEQISPSRCALIFLFNIIPRCIVVIGLFIFGTLFLAYTVSLSELLLNALALTFISEIDEMLSEAFVPNAVLFVQRHLNPIPLHHHAASQDVVKRSILYRHVDIPVLARYVVLFCTLAATYFIVRVDLDDRLERAYSVLCEFDTDFVWAQDKATGVVLTSNTRPATRDLYESTSPEVRYQIQAVAQRAGMLAHPAVRDKFQDTDLPGPVYHDLANWWPSEERAELDERIEVLENKFKETHDRAPYVIQCRDQDRWRYSGSYYAYMDRTFWNAAREAVGGLPPRSGVNTSAVQGCDHVADLCFTDNEMMRFTTRRLCPETCRCAEPTSGIYRLWGCAPQCVQKLRTARDEWIQNNDCADSANSTSLPDGFVRYFQGVDNLRGFDDWKAEVLQEMADIQGVNFTMKAILNGCSMMANGRGWWEFCKKDHTHDDAYGDVAVYCPRTCGIC